MNRPDAHIKEAPPQEQPQENSLKGQHLNEAVEGLTLHPKTGENQENLSQEGNQERPDALTGTTGGGNPTDFKTLFAGKNLNEAISILIPNINHALKVGATARKNEPLIQAMIRDYRELMTVSSALKSLTQNTGNSLAAQMGSNTQNQNAV